MSSASSVRPARSPCRPPASTATRSSTASWTTRSKCGFAPRGAPLALFSLPTKPQCPAKACGDWCPAAAPHFPCPVRPKRCQPLLLLHGKLCFSPAVSLHPSSPLFRRISLCSGWALGIEDVLLGAWETHGNPRSVQGWGRAFSHLLWLYFPTEHLQEENYILRDLVLNKAIFLISLQAGKSYCSPPWLVGKLRRSAGSREGPAESEC